jgi:multisubunit Na+/H+ antiporter MnhF subunit
VSSWTLAAVALMAGGLGPALWCGATGDAIDRLVGLELASAVTILVLLLLSQVASQSSYLIVPLVLVALAFAGTLVFTRLLGPRS